MSQWSFCLFGFFLKSVYSRGFHYWWVTFQFQDVEKCLNRCLNRRICRESLLMPATEKFIVSFQIPRELKSDCVSASDIWKENEHWLIRIPQITPKETTMTALSAFGFTPVADGQIKFLLPSLPCVLDGWIPCHPFFPVKYNSRGLGIDTKIPETSLVGLLHLREGKEHICIYKRAIFLLAEDIQWADLVLMSFNLSLSTLALLFSKSAAYCLCTRLGCCLWTCCTVFFWRLLLFWKHFLPSPSHARILGVSKQPTV